MKCMKVGRIALGHLRQARVNPMVSIKPNKLLVQNQRSFFGKNNKEESVKKEEVEEEDKVEEEEKKQDEKQSDEEKEKEPSTSSGSSSDSDVELSQEDIKKIKALIAE